MTLKIPWLRIEIDLSSKEINGRLDRIEATLDRNHKETLKAMSDNEKAIIAAFDAETTRLATEIEDLINNRPEDDAEFNAALLERVAKFKALGANGQPPTV